MDDQTVEQAICECCNQQADKNLMCKDQGLIVCYDCWINAEAILIKDMLKHYAIDNTDGLFMNRSKSYY